MARGNDQQRGRLATLQDMVTGGGHALLGQAQTLADDVQRRLTEVGRDVGAVLEDNLGDAIDELISRLSVSFRREIESLADRLGTVEGLLAGLPAGPLIDLLEPARALAQQAIESAAASNMQIEEMSMRLETAERRALQAGTEANAADPRNAALREQLEQLQLRLLELGREVGTRVGEVTALAERLGRVETRLAEQSREHAGRTADVAALRERLSRLEARLSDLSREQVARSVEAAGLRERVFRLEHRAHAADPARLVDDATGDDAES